MLYMPDNEGCNGFSLLGGTSCFLANITALEESVDRPSFYLDTSVRGDLPLTCRGGWLDISTEPALLYCRGGLLPGGAGGAGRLGVRGGGGGLRQGCPLCRHTGL